MKTRFEHEHPDDDFLRSSGDLDFTSFFLFFFSFFLDRPRSRESYSSEYSSSPLLPLPLFRRSPIMFFVLAPFFSFFFAFLLCDLFFLSLSYLFFLSLLSFLSFFLVLGFEVLDGSLGTRANRSRRSDIGPFKPFSPELLSRLASFGRAQSRRQCLFPCIVSLLLIVIFRWRSGGQPRVAVRDRPSICH